MEEVERVSLTASSCTPSHIINNEATALYEIHHEAKAALEEKDRLKSVPRLLKVLGKMN